MAIAVGLRAAATAAVTGIEDAAARALVKLEQSLSNRTRERILSIERAVLPLGMGAEPVDLDTVVTIARTIRESRSLRVDYRRHDGTSTAFVTAQDDRTCVLEAGAFSAKNSSSTSA